MNDSLDFVRAIARWWQRPRVRRGVMALFGLWFLNAIIGTITEKWWCDALGVGALWAARTFAQWQLFFASALLNCALLLALIHFLTPHREQLFHVNQTSVLVRGVAAYAQHGRRLAWYGGLLWVWWQSRRAALWGDEWLLWRSGTNWGERDLSGADWSAWVWGWPLVDALNRIVWSSVTLALLFGFALHSAQIALLSLRRQNENTLLGARRFLWFLGALWFACLALRYYWLRAQNAVTWRGNDATVPAGWDWLSWHWTRLTDNAGIALAVGGCLLCALALIFSASNRRHFSRWTWSAAFAAWWLPGTLQVLVGGPLWRLVVAPDENAREAPFVAAYRTATQRAWRVQTQSRVVKVEPVGILNAVERAELERTARLWDEDALQATLGDANASVPSTLNYENKRLVGVSTDGVYDATRVVDGKPPLLHAFTPPISWPVPTTHETRGDIALSGAARVLWAWRLRDVGALWRSRATLHTDWDERARALLPGARPVDAPYLTPRGWLVQNLSGTTARLPGVLRVANLRGESAQISDCAQIVIAPAGQTQLWASRDDEPWVRAWRTLAGAALRSGEGAPVGRRTSKSTSEARVQVWNQLERTPNPNWLCNEIEYALLATPATGAGPAGSRWVLQGAIRDQTRLAGWLQIDATNESTPNSADAWRVWQIAPNLARLEPLWPLNEEAVDSEAAITARATEMKEARVRSKVLMAPLWRGESGQATHVALLLWQNQYEAPSPARLPLWAMPITGWRLHRVALGDAAREDRVVVARNAGELLGLWSQVAPPLTPAQNEILATRHAVQQLLNLLEQEEKAARTGDWPSAEILRDKQREILEQMK